MRKGEREKAISYIKKVDPTLGDLIVRIGSLEERNAECYFISLVSSIISQQLSTKVADVIYARFEALFNDQITPQEVQKIEDQTIRDIGISWSKIKYIKALSEYALKSNKVFEKFDSMSDEEIIKELTQVKGIGRWTAEMFLIFTMERPDVFSFGDLGLKRAIQRWYGFKTEPKESQIAKITLQWKPYRSIASRYLWKSLALS